MVQILYYISHLNSLTSFISCLKMTSGMDFYCLNTHSIYEVHLLLRNAAPSLDPHIHFDIS